MVCSGPNINDVDLNHKGMFLIGKNSMGRIPLEHLNITLYKRAVEEQVEEALEATLFDEQKIRNAFASAIEATFGGGVTVESRIVQKIDILGSMCTSPASYPQMLIIT